MTSYGTIKTQTLLYCIVKYAQGVKVDHVTNSADELPFHALQAISKDRSFVDSLIFCLEELHTLCMHYNFHFEIRHVCPFYAHYCLHRIYISTFLYTYLIGMLNDISPCGM
jgi:hypothetical protein